MGGRGKTPVVAHVARLLVAAGERPAILSRGYGRRIREDGVVVVSDGDHLRADLDRAGDEPLMLSRAVPGAAVLVCEQRALAKAYADRVLGSTVCILDDGFQHVAVPRMTDVVIVAEDDLRQRALPFGRLRESAAALERADAVIVDGEIDDADTRRIGARVFNMQRSLGSATTAGAAVPMPSKDKPVVAVAGIAAPARFQRALEHAGWSVTKHITFRDHHRYSFDDVRAIARAVHETHAAGIVTTEKDAVRLLPLRPLPFAVAVTPLQISFNPASSFDDWLTARLAEHRA